MWVDQSFLMSVDVLDRQYGETNRLFSNEGAYLKQLMAHAF